MNIFVTPLMFILLTILSTFSLNAQADNFFSYIGGDQYDTSRSVTVDSNDNIYVTGWTFTQDLETTSNAPQSAHKGNADIFIAKFSPDGQNMEFLTYFGGNGNDTAHDIAVDSAGNIYVVGTTTSNDLLMVNPVQSVLKGTSDAFIIKINPDGLISFSSYFGGGDNETGKAIVIDSDGDIYFTGSTTSTDLFTSTTSIDATCGNDGLCDQVDMSDDSTRQSDGYVALFMQDTADVYLPDYATYIGGDSDDAIHDITVDADKLIYITGETGSNDFPTKNAFQDTLAGGFAGGYDAFVLALDPLKNGNDGLVYSSFLGGDGEDFGNAISVIENGMVYITGDTNSLDFPTSSQAIFDQFSGGNADVFIAQFNTKTSANSSLVFSTYLGGDSDDVAYDITTDENNDIYIAGMTGSSDFPILRSTQPGYEGNNDGFFVKIKGDSKTIEYASYFGSFSIDFSFAITVDQNGFIYLAGETESDDLSSDNAWKTTYSNNADGYVAKIDPFNMPPINQPANPNESGGGGSMNFWLLIMFLTLFMYRIIKGEVQVLPRANTREMGILQTPINVIS